MITTITGKLVDLGEAEATLSVGPLEYQVFVPELVRRQLQPRVGNEVRLRTIEYFEGNPQQGRLTPRLIGFLSPVEREFFEVICSVDGVGVKKALRALVRPVAEIATAIEEKDVKQLSALPGIGPAVAERMIAKLRRKMAKFALMVEPALPDEDAAVRDVLREACEALVTLGHTTLDARQKVNAVAKSKVKLQSVEDVLMEVYRQEHPRP